MRGKTVGDGKEAEEWGNWVGWIEWEWMDGWTEDDGLEMMMLGCIKREEKKKKQKERATNENNITRVYNDC